MLRLEIVLALLISVSSLFVSSQTFVLNGSTYLGKTKREIEKINEAGNSKFDFKQKDGRITTIIYKDSLNSMVHHFYFARRGPFGLGPWKCIIYLVNVGNKPQYEKIKADLLTKCQKTLDRLIQVSGTKEYDWLSYRRDSSRLYTFVVQKHHDRRNNR